MKVLITVVALTLCLALGTSGCHPASPSAANSGPPVGAPANGSNNQTPVATRPAASVSDADLAKAGVNEAGRVPILEYHNIRVGKTPYDRSPADFRKDLDTLYRDGYRPVSFHDYLDNHIDIPLGMSPIVLTFDDSSRTQFRYLDDGRLDPDCAFAILKAFHEAHPDFGMKGIFFMNASPTGNPAPVFAQEPTAQKKVKELLAAGMEIGNHTVNHPSLKKLSDAVVQKEIADCEIGIHKLAPEVVVDTLALPFGASPVNKKLAESGEADGVKYHIRAVLLVGAEPAPSPSSVKYNPVRLPRIIAYSGVMGSEYWLGQLKAHPKSRYISDGDPNTVTVPKAGEKNIERARLGNAKLRVY